MINITENLFEDEKIRMIEIEQPDSDTILIIWIKLLCLAGKQNRRGKISVTPKKPFTLETLSKVIEREPQIVKRALEIFKEYSMIEVDDAGIIQITNWIKYQKNKTKQERIRADNQLVENEEQIRKDVQTIVDTWNNSKLPPVMRLDRGSRRYSFLTTRIRDYGTQEVLRAVDIAAKSSFLKNQNWFSFEWFVRPNNFIKVLEGTYNREVNKLKRDLKGWLDE